jgi:MoxR-like ATPase
LDDTNDTILTSVTSTDNNDEVDDDLIATKDNQTTESEDKGENKKDAESDKNSQSSSEDKSSKQNESANPNINIKLNRSPLKMVKPANITDNKNKATFDLDVKSIYDRIETEIKKRIAGKLDVIKLMFVAMIANGHVLLEGAPGVAKTTMTKALAETVQASFGRIQGTPDLMFKDIVGYTYVDDNNQLQVKKGPIFSNILLIDELNRAPPRTTTSLLESLEERQVTMGDSTIPLPKPFIAMATQNPLNVEGTTPLPKVLADRFLMRIAVDYPSMEEEQQMLRLKQSEEKTTINKVISIKDVLEMQEIVKKVVLPEPVLKYITEIVGATRTDIHVVMGGSPRSEISFMQCGKALALIEGRNEVTFDDIKYLAKPVLSHRITVRSTGAVGVNGIIDGIIANIPTDDIK